MNLFEIVKYGVSCREAAERYGVEVNRYGMALCPFHNDRHPSLYVADDHYYCFACGEHGDVIDFVGKAVSACRPMMRHGSWRQTFTLARTSRPAQRRSTQSASEQKHSSSGKTSGCAFLFCRITPVCCGTGRCGMRRNHLTSLFTHGSWKPATSSTRRNTTLDILCAGDSHERAEVIQQQMADGKLDRLRRRLEKIHKEELEDGYDTAGVA